VLNGVSVSLRQCPTEWMQHHGFFGSNGLKLGQDQVFFEDSRSKKIDRIRSLGCTHFVDDLPEVFSEPAFPSKVRKLLFAPRPEAPVGNDVQVFKSWYEIYHWFFNLQDGK
jgi:hypothetical protein